MNTSLFLDSWEGTVFTTISLVSLHFANLQMTCNNDMENNIIKFIKNGGEPVVPQVEEKIAHIECSICMENIIIEKQPANDFTATECGHTFHTHCLMTSVAHLGFGCPLCRAEMAQAVEEVEEYDEDDDDEDDEIYDDYALRGFRFFTENLLGEEHSAEDLQEETEDNEYFEEQFDDLEQMTPSVDYIHQELLEKGVTFKELVSAFLFNQDNYYGGRNLHKINGKIVGKFINILDKFAEQADEE